MQDVGGSKDPPSVYRQQARHVRRSQIVDGVPELALCKRRRCVLSSVRAVTENLKPLRCCQPDDVNGERCCQGQLCLLSEIKFTFNDGVRVVSPAHCVPLL